MIEMAPAQRSPGFSGEGTKNRVDGPGAAAIENRETQDRLTERLAVRVPVVRFAARHDLSRSGSAPREGDPIDKEMFQRPVAEWRAAGLGLHFPKAEPHPVDHV